MPKLIMMSGPSGSGKSFKAKQLMTADSNLVRVNRDLIRGMSILKWTRVREAWIIDAEIAMVQAAAKTKRNVVVDDTNLNYRDEIRWKQVANDMVYDFQVIKMDTPLELCVAQDKGSDRASVGRDVIERQFLRAGLVKWPEDKQVVIFDIDGTLADLEHRVPWITIGANCPNCEGTGELFSTSWGKPSAIIRDELPEQDKCPYCENGKIVKKNHDMFYSQVQDDVPIDIVVRWIQECKKHFYILIVSGRSPEKCSQATIDWLYEYDIPYDHIYMRRAYNHGPDYDEKQLILDDILKTLPKEKIAFVVDDRPSVVEMWRKNGLRVIPVRGRDDDPFYSYDSEYEKKLTEEVKAKVVTGP